MNQAALLEKFKNEQLATATPAQLVTMLYDRMVLDVDRGIAAIEAGNRMEANNQIQHAQAIIAELQSSLDHTIWDGAKNLDALYSWLTSQLITANVQQDAELARVCRDILSPLRDAWHEAAAMVAAGGGNAPSPAPTAAGVSAGGAGAAGGTGVAGTAGAAAAFAPPIAVPAESVTIRELGVG